MTERERHGVEMAKVGILMGSDSDLEIMSKAAKMLEDFGIDYEMNVISAHREPDVFVEYAKTAKDRGIDVIIAGAGGAAHLPVGKPAVRPDALCPLHRRGAAGAGAGNGDSPKATEGKIHHRRLSRRAGQVRVPGRDSAA